MKNVLLLLIGLSVFLLSGCAGGDNEAGSGAPFAVVTDQAGREVVLQDVPERIVSLSPSNTEIVFALGMADRVVGVTDYCNYPPEAEAKAKVGGFSNPNLELILELEADLVLAGSLHEEFIPRLEEMGIPVLVLAPETLADVYASLMLVAEVTGSTEQGELLVAEIQERVSRVQAALGSLNEDEKVVVYYEVYSDPLMSAGAGTLINEIITLSGGRNIFADLAEQYPKVSAESVVERQPQVILFPDYHGSAEIMAEQMTERPGWESIPALRENRAYAVHDDAFTRPGPRVVDAIEQTAKLFYPGLF
ncbi:MAG: cobalamin-binding protein [Bacillota bacterium]